MVGWALGCLAAACSVEIPEEGGDEVLAFREETPPVLEVEDEVCPGWRQVARRHDAGGCGNIAAPHGTWLGSKLFPAWGGAYGKYCVYDFSEGGTPPPDDIDALHDQPQFEAVAAECLSVLPQSELDDALNPALSALVADRLDTVSGGEIDITATASGRTPVRVAVIDTTPLADPTTPRDDHGLVVASLIEEVAHGCGNTSPFCKVVIDNVLGLPRFGPGRNQKDPVRGGYIAHHSEIAAGVYNAVRAWEQRGGQERLIINLSVGWLRPFGAPGQSPAVDALQLALQRASCEGALIIAAAGNARDDCDVGPLMPAQWELEPAPTPAQCQAQPINIAAPVASGAAYKPLVHSVGGLGFDDEALSVSRIAGRPRLAAIADHVVGGDLSFTARTGTSMSAAAATAVATLVWGYRGNLTSHEVAALLWSSGVPTGETADYGLGGATGEIRRLTACGALAAACASPGSCPPTFALDCVTTPMSSADLDAAIDGIQVLPANTHTIAVTASGTCDAYCGEAPSVNNYAGGVPPVCELPSGEARTDYLVQPAPLNPACPTCTIVDDGAPGVDYHVTILAAIAEKYLSQPAITSVVVDVKLADGTKQTYRLGAPALGAVVQALELSPPPASEVISGTISIWFGSSSAAVVGDLLMPLAL